jgi:magnesium-transporting ATPase (P-type)
MITGDNLLTAANVSKQIELGSNTLILESINGNIVAKIENE